MVTYRLPSFKEIGTALITFEVGNIKARHVVHKDLLIHESPYFRTMFQNNWKESNQTKALSLPLTNANVFPRFLDWLYFRKLDTTPATIAANTCANCSGPCEGINSSIERTLDTECIDPQDDDKIEDLLAKVAQRDNTTALYIFADQYDFPSLREQIINQRWRDYMNKNSGFPYATIIQAFDHLPSTSPLCRLMIDVCVEVWEPDDDYECPSERKLRSKLPIDFLFKLAAKLAEKARDRWTPGAVAGLCRYHEHGHDAEAVEACRRKLRAAEVDVRPSWDVLEVMRADRDCDKARLNAYNHPDMYDLY